MDYSYFSTVPTAYNSYGGGLPPNPAVQQPQAVTHNISEGQYSSASPDVPEQAYGSYPHHPSYIPQYEPNSLAPDLNVTGTSLDHRSINGGQGPDMEGERGGGRSSSEEKDALTPAKSRRKAQNRAAQRAFRERKERHVKELEQKVASLEQTSNNLMADNQRLKREIQRISTENEILRATSNAPAASSAQQHHHHHHGGGGGSSKDNRGATMPGSVTGPTKYSPADFYNSIIQAHRDKTPTHRLTVSEHTGERLLGARATWDLIQNHPLFKQGIVDVAQVSDRLRKVVQCDGQGPAFEERCILDAIEESVVSRAPRGRGL
ncbi:MAG: hypothetical protein M1816_002384 [Peltula sp. TS41687]|nr:MAG: hypothetical protein M1816_002384 [Peltula sp. TS41687]